MHKPKVESGLSKQMLSNFQADNSCNCKKVEAQVNIWVVHKKSCTNKKACV